MPSEDAAQGSNREAVMPRRAEQRSDSDLQIEQLILQAKQEWERTFDCVPDCIVLLDLDLRARRVNKALAGRLGLHPRELIGRPLEELVDRPEAPAEVSSRIRAMAGQESASASELAIPCLGGHFFLTVAPYRDKGGGRAGTILVAHDISKWKILEQQLEQSRKLEALGTLAGGVAHDFNNILGVILGYAEMMLNGSDKDSPQARRLGEIMQAGARAKALVRQILAFSRHGDLPGSPLRLSPLVKEVLKPFQASLPGNIALKLKLASESDLVLADPTMIHQILVNLCANAVHAMQECGGTLEVGIEDASARDSPLPPELSELGPGDYLRLSVRDTGAGIPREIAGRIFDPFFTTKGPGQGSGMGLAVVHGIVHRLDGAILVESEPGHGTAMHVFLPRVQDQGHPVSAEAQPLPTGHGRILLVDDEPGLIEIGREALHGLGYEVVTAKDGRQALEAFRTKPQDFDLVLADQVMPQMSGIELAQEIRSIRPDIPIVLCTGFGDAVPADATGAQGIREVLAKPLLKRDLAEAVRRVLGQGE